MDILSVIEIPSLYILVKYAGFQAAIGVSGGHSKHATLNQCWCNAGTTSTMLYQHLANIGKLSNVCGGGHFDDVTLLNCARFDAHNLIDRYR